MSGIYPDRLTTTADDEVKAEAEAARSVYEAVAAGCNYAHEVSERTGMTESRAIFHLIQLRRAGWVRLNDDDNDRLNRWYTTTQGMIRNQVQRAAATLDGLPPEVRGQLSARTTRRSS